jgi:RHS repeat-associated protein
MTDPAGVVANTYKYDPYGTIVAQTETTPKTNLFRFAGGLYSSTLGLHKFGMRWYDQKLQRWTQQGPIDQAGDLREGNRYGYVGDDPVNLADLSGAKGEGGTLACAVVGTAVGFRFGPGAGAFTGGICSGLVNPEETGVDRNESRRRSNRPPANQGDFPAKRRCRSCA